MKSTFLPAAALALMTCAAHAPQPAWAKAAQPPAALQALVAPSPDESRKEIRAFIETNAAMAGATSACDANEGRMVEFCSNLILLNWSDLTGLPDVGGQDFRQQSRAAWAHQEDAARALQQSKPPGHCSDVLALEQSSTIWEMCKRPPRDDAPELPQTMQIQ